jgi:biotin synthase
MDWARRSLTGRPLTEAELEPLLGRDTPLLSLLQEAYEVRRTFFGNRVQVHILSNAQNARCPEDCGYCSQSAATEAPLRPYSWKSRPELLKEAQEAYDAGAYRYCIVASGRGPTAQQVQHVAEAVREIKLRVPVQVCASLGLVDEGMARTLKGAGVDRLNHNLNTSEAHYPRICTTHTYGDRLATLQAARAADLELCSGLIVGLGETDRDLVELARVLRELETASIPVNFLIPIEGNPVQSDGSLTPERCLRVLAMFRLANPRAEIRAAGGREGHLRSLEALALYPANSLFVRGYLTTTGGGPVETYRMIRDAGFVVERADGRIVPWVELGLDETFKVGGTAQILKPEVRAQVG